MKKAAAAFVTVVVLAVGIWAVISFAHHDTSSIPPRPEDTSLEFWICDDVSETDWSGHDEIKGWMGASEYLGKGYRAGTQGERPRTRVSYIITAWPDYADGGNYITTIEITDPAVSVYGLTVDSRPEEFKQVMASMGYEVETVNDELLRAVKGDLTFTLQHGASPYLRVSAKVTNREGIVF